MNKTELRRIVSEDRTPLFKRLRGETLALIDLYECRTEEVSAEQICCWGITRGLISKEEGEFIHGVMTLHEQPNVIDPAASFT